MAKNTTGKKSALFRDVVSTYSGFILILPLSYLLRINYSRSLDLETFGLIYGLIAFLGIITIFADFGQDNTFRHFASVALKKRNYKQVRELFWKTGSIQIILTVIITIILYICSKPLAENYFLFPRGEPFIVGYLFFFLFINITNPYRNIFIIYNQQKINYFADAIKHALILGFTIYFLQQDTPNLYHLGLSWAGSQIVATAILIFIAIRRYPFLWDNIQIKIPKKDEFSFSFQVLISNFGNIFFQRLDIILITLFLTLADVGIYSNSLSVLSIIGLFFAPLSAYIVPIISRNTNNKKTLRKFIRALYKWGFLVSLPICIFLMIFSKEYLVILFGEKFIAGVLLTQIFSIGVILKIYMQTNFHILIGLGKVKTRTILIFSLIVLNIILDIYFALQGNMVGIAFSTVFCWLLGFLATSKIIATIAKIEIKVVTLAKIFISLLVFYVVVEMLRRVVTYNNWLELLVVFPIAYGIYFLVARILNIYSLKQIKELIQ